MQKNLTTAALAALTGGVLLLAQSARTAEVQFKAAQHKEQVEGDLKGAIEQYKKIAQGSDRTLAAKALVAIGQCYEKLGNAEARSAYERVVREFGDQAESVALAHARMAALQSPAAAHTITRQVWAGPGVDGDGYGSPSLDGRYLTFTNWATGDLGLRDLTTGTNRLLTNSGGWEASGDYAENSVVSPDGRLVAYLWFVQKEFRDELRIIPIGGGAPRTLYRGGENRSTGMRPRGWTPDGKQLVVVHTLSDRTNQIAMVSVQDGSIRALKSFEWQYPSPSISPDGRYITYYLSNIGKAQDRGIFVLATDGSRETAVVQSPAKDVAPLWSPEGSRILFMSDRTGNPSLWSAPILDGKPNGPAELVKADIGSVRPLGMTRSGTLYYVLSGSSRVNIYTAGLGADMKVSKEPGLAVERFVNSNAGPAWSPDGRYLAYYSRRQTRLLLVVRTLNTGEERDIPLKLSVHQFFGAGPKWFPDGRSVMLLAREPQRPGLSFYRLDLANGNTELLHHTNHSFQGFALSPDGKAIFYSEKDDSVISGGTRLVRFDLETRRETELKKGEWFIELAVSPDSKQLAYLVSVGNGPSYLGVIAADGGKSREVFRGSHWDDGSRYEALAWTPDQRCLVFVRGGTGKGSVLWRVPVSGGQPEQMGVSMMSRIKSPQVHPDGRRIVFGTSDDENSEVWALENFLPKTVAPK